MKRLVAKDREGAVSVAVMRSYFERAFAETTGGLLDGSLAVEEVDGAFYCYADPDVDRFWMGFAVGMRCAERILKAEQAALAEAPDGR